MNSHPKFAIVRLRPNDDVFTLFRLLVQHGYPEVSFVNGLREEAFLPRTSIAGLDAGTTSMESAEGGGNRQGGRTGGSKTSRGATDCFVPASRLRTPPPNSVGTALASLSLMTPNQGLLPSLGLPTSLPMTMLTDHQPPYSLPPTAVFPPMPAVSTELTGLLLNGAGSMNAIASNGSSCRVQQQQSSRPAPSQSPRNGSSSNDSSGGTTQLRQRGSRAQTDDPSVYANCRLCQNKIMASRLSNLTNHVRRHASLKQFQCCYCEYTHNEMAKVRLHMLHNHKDKDSQPIDNLSPEMQAQWDFLMEQCFPEYNKEFFTKDMVSTAASISANSRVSQVNIPTVTPSLADLQRHYMKPLGHKVIAKTELSQTFVKIEKEEEEEPEVNNYTCIECGEIVAEGQLQVHLRQAHASDCIPYACAACGYENSDQWKVRLHISLKHAENAADVAVNARSSATNFNAFVPKFFPDYGPKNNDDDDLLATIRKEVTEPVVASVEVVANGVQQTGVSRQKDSKDPLHGLEDLRCQLCHKVMAGSRPMSSLLNHAKRHYHTKQFACPRCSYCSSEAAHVRSHMKLKHSLLGEAPLDNKNTKLQTAWMQIMARCFPAVAPKLGKFRFKNLRGKPGRPRLYPKQREGGGGRTTRATTAAGTRVPGSAVKCRLCAKIVPSQDLISHANGHVPVKPFACTVCHFRSAEYQQLRVHLLKHKSVRDRSRPLVKQDTSNLRSQYVKYCFGDKP